MYVCAKCKIEMTCTKTGRPVIYSDSHIYSGDEFTCRSCDSIIVACVSAPYHCGNALVKLEHAKPIDMSKAK